MYMYMHLIFLCSPFQVKAYRIVYHFYFLVLVTNIAAAVFFSLEIPLFLNSDCATLRI